MFYTWAACASIDSVSLPTSLSASKFSVVAGRTDLRTKRKNFLLIQLLCRELRLWVLPSLVATQNPSGFPPARELGHAVEDLWAINGTSSPDGTSRHATCLPARSLRQVKAGWSVPPVSYCSSSLAVAISRFQRAISSIWYCRNSAGPVTSKGVLRRAKCSLISGDVPACLK